MSDPERSTACYRDGFGREFHTDSNQPEDNVWLGGVHAATSWSAGAFLHFTLFPARLPARPVSRNVQIGFNVDDIQAAHAQAHARAQAVAAGIAVAHAPRPGPWGTTARYRDPDGNLVSSTQR